MLLEELPESDEPDVLEEPVEPDVPPEVEEVSELELELELELVVLLAVGVDEDVVSVSVEPESELESELELELEVELELELELFVELDPVAALGTVAATASDPAMPLAATTAVIVAVRTLPCRTDRAAPSASMA